MVSLLPFWNKCIAIDKRKHWKEGKDKRSPLLYNMAIAYPSSGQANMVSKSHRKENYHSFLSFFSAPDFHPSIASGPVIPCSSRFLFLSSLSRSFCALNSSQETATASETDSPFWFPSDAFSLVKSTNRSSAVVSSLADAGKGRTASSPAYDRSPVRNAHSTACSTGSSNMYGRKGTTARPSCRH